MGANVKKEDGSRNTALYWAALFGHLEAVILLLERGADIDAGQGAGGTPLQAAAVEGHTKVAVWLAAKGAKKDVYSAAALGDQEYVLAAIKKDPAIVKSTPALDGRTLLHLAARGGFRDLVALLIEHRADVHAAGDGFTPLYYAAAHGHASVIELLAAKGAKIDVVDSNGESALMHAVMRDQPGAVKALLKHKANVNLKTPLGNYTPLHFAMTWNSSKEVVELLLSAGADPNARNNLGFSPYDLAKHSNNSKTNVELLKKFGGKE
jgi:ankyrin repeat protein